jgi:transposase
MFIRKLVNRSGSISVQIISKSGGKYKVINTIGCGHTNQEVEFLYQRARQYLEQIKGQSSIFINRDDALIESYISNLRNSQVQVIGPELVFGKIYDAIGFSKAIEDDAFRHMVITRLYEPGSKLKTIDYLQRFLGIYISVDELYRFLDKLRNRLKEKVEQIVFEHSKRILKGNISVVFYDMTTLHFDASSEDDLRRTGFSKVGKHQKPQIYLGLLVGLHGFPIGYDIFEGNISEGHTLIPTLKKFENRFKLDKPIVVADAGLLSNDNIAILKETGYKYIIGARIKNETASIKDKILKLKWTDGQGRNITPDPHRRLIVSYSEKRAVKDAYNRRRGLQRLEKKVKSGKLSKSNINNRGYNKYLKLIGDLRVEIDYKKFEADQQWDGLKGYITNTKLPTQKVIEKYNQLWQIEKAFRISKTDLKIRPIYHRLRHRIEGHICIAFVSYSIYKELERVLYKERSNITVSRAADLTHNMYQLNIKLPESNHSKSVLLQMDQEQAELYQAILRNY